MSAPRPGTRRSLLGRLLAPVRLNLLRAVRSAQGSDYLAGGLALGGFWLWTPLTVLHIPVVLLAARLVNVSRMAAIAMILVSNPLTIVPIWVLDFVVGASVTPGGSKNSPLRNPERLLADPFAVFQIGLHDYLTLSVGALLLGGLSSTILFFVARRWAFVVAHRRHLRRARSAARVAAAATAHHGPRPGGQEAP